MEEDKNMQLVDDYEAIPYKYVPPIAKKWNNLKSDVEIQKLLVTDSRPKVCDVLFINLKYHCMKY